MLRIPDYEAVEPTISLWTTYIDFVQGGDYETVAIIVFALIIVWGVWDTLRTNQDMKLDDGVASDLLIVGIVAVIGGLVWPILVPCVLVAAIVGAVYQLMRKFNGKKK